LRKLTGLQSKALIRISILRRGSSSGEPLHGSVRTFLVEAFDA
jgi:hypothetical protein